MTIRSRIIVWYAAALVLALGAIAATIYYEIFVEHPAVDIAWRLNAVGESPEEELAEAILFAGVPAALFSLLVAWVLLRRAFAPVERLTAAVERLHWNNLRSHLPRGIENDELDRLTDVFNAMTDRLDQSFQRVRDFTLHASHELKTPLTAMRGEIETALRDEPLPASAVRRLSSLLEEINRLTQIVDGLNFMAKADAGMLKFEREPVPLHELVEEAADDARALATHTAISVQVEATPVIVTGDRRRLRQLLLVLTDNAVKYNQHGGQVRFTLRSDEDGAVIEISNTGVGIPASSLDRVFDRFYRGDASHNRNADGCGLGLSIAREIAQAHGGTIRVTSADSGWTTFTVRLPAEQLAPSSRPAERSLATAAAV